MKKSRALRESDIQYSKGVRGRHSGGATALETQHDRLADARSFRTSNVIDGYNRDVTGIEADLTLPAVWSIRTRERVKEWRRMSKAIHCDEGLQEAD